MNIAQKQRAFSRTGLFVSEIRVNDKIDSRKNIKSYENEAYF